MLDFAGCAVAMGNAEDSVKADFCDFLTNEEDGVSHAIETILQKRNKSYRIINGRSKKIHTDAKIRVFE